MSYVAKDNVADAVIKVKILPKQKEIKNEEAFSIKNIRQTLANTPLFQIKELFR